MGAPRERGNGKRRLAIRRCVALVAPAVLGGLLAAGVLAPTTSVSSEPVAIQQAVRPVVSSVEPASVTAASTIPPSTILATASSAARLSKKRCKTGSGMERGLTRDAIAVHRALCARYPSIKSYGGRRSGGGSYHSSGRAVDAMIPNRSTGWKAAKWLRANRSRLGVTEVIFARKVWTVRRSSEGWRSMSDRGGATANHYDHVHVSVSGNRAKG